MVNFKEALKGNLRKIKNSNSYFKEIGDTKIVRMGTYKDITLKNCASGYIDALDDHKLEIGTGIAVTALTTLSALYSYPPASEASRYIYGGVNTAKSLYPFWFKPWSLVNLTRDAIPVLETPGIIQALDGAGATVGTYGLKRAVKKQEQQEKK